MTLWDVLVTMQNGRISRAQFLQVGVSLATIAAGCGDDGTSGAGAAGGAGGDSSGGASSTGGTASTSGGAGPTTTTTTTVSGTGGAGGSASVCLAAISASISGNHAQGPHLLDIPLADIEAGVEKVYSAQGQANHCHEVTLTAADFATLKSGGSVTKFSCNGGDHEYTMSCGANPTPVAPDCGATPNAGACE